MALVNFNITELDSPLDIREALLVNREPAEEPIRQKQSDTRERFCVRLPAEAVVEL